MPHPDTDQDDHEIEDEFDEYMIEEEDENEEEDDGGVNPVSQKSPNRLAKQAWVASLNHGVPKAN